MQVGRADVTALAAARSIASNGVTAFYRGLAAPLTTVAAFNAILFSSRGAAERMLASDGGWAEQLPAYRTCTACMRGHLPSPRA